MKNQAKNRRIYAEVYVEHEGNRIWVNEFMRLIFSGKTKKVALKLSTVEVKDGDY